MTKAYSSKFNAQRGAKSAGLNLDMLEFYKTETGAYGFREMEASDVFDEPALDLPEVEIHEVETVVDTTPPIEVRQAPPAVVGSDLVSVPNAAAATSEKPTLSVLTPLGRAAKGKTKLVVEAASAEDGVTTTELKALTGWTKFGGFYNAIEGAGLKLHRCRENGDTRWFAVPADETRVRAYIEETPAARWILYGVYDDAAAVHSAVAAEAVEDGETTSFTYGKRGEVYVHVATVEAAQTAKAA